MAVDLRASFLGNVAFGAGLGLLAGAIEGAALAMTLPLPLSPGGALALALIDAAVMAAFGAVCGALPAVILPVLPADRASAFLRATAAMLLAGVVFWLDAAGALRDGDVPRGVVLAAVPFAVWSIVYAVARLLWERSSPWLRRAPYVVAGLALIASAAAPFLRRAPAAGADRPNVLLVSIDTLRRDRVSAYGEPGAAPTPHFDRLAAEGVLFLDAVAPMPETAPSHASMLTGLHPLRHGVLSNGHVLDAGRKTITEVLAAEGYATGAFVSSFALDSRVGLTGGFDVYDDSLPPGPPGWTRIRVMSRLAAAWMALGNPAATPWLLEREGKLTNERFLRWLDAQDRPFFAFVHWFEPHAPYDARTHDHGFDMRARMEQGDAATYTPEERAAAIAQYAEEVTFTDGLLGDLLTALEQRGHADDTLVIVIADHGEMLGEHGIDFNHHGVWEEGIRIPLAIRAPGRPIAVRRVAAQVGPADLPNTILDWAALPRMDETEGVSLLEYASGHRAQSRWASLIGRKARSFSEGALVGARHDGFKYVKELGSDGESLFFLTEDPGEQRDVARVPDQRRNLELLRSLVSPEVEAMRARLEGGGPAVTDSTRQALESLGYIE